MELRFQFRILGPLEVWADGAQMRLRGPRQERALAALLLDAGRVVTVDHLVDAVWDDPPSTARRQIQDLVTGLRRSLAGAGAADGVIATKRAGYLLSVAPEEFDAHQFEHLTAVARGAPDPEAAARVLRDALTVVRGPVLAGISSRALEPSIAQWNERLLVAREDLLEHELMLGQHHRVLGELTAQVARHPWRDRSVRMLMLALHRSGRDPEALATYQEFRIRLVEEAGLDPSTELQQLHQAILRGGADAAGPAPEASVSAPETSVPAQLPLDVHGFVGRSRELVRLDAIAALAGEQPTATIIAAVGGTAGVGKTALAVHWAHRVAGRFPDGQLHVNLRGFNPGGTVTPAEAVRGFLDALHVPAERIPIDFDAQVGLYRSLLADRRMLVLLDNARDVDQVRPLLPGAPGCVVVVTSRNQLADLVAAECAHPVVLDLLTEDEAWEFVTRRLGHGRAVAEPESVGDIIASSARLPLALAVVTARAAIRPGFPLAAVADQLRQARGRLDAVAGDSPCTDLRAVLSWSYEALGADTARLFRLLGLHPGPDIAVAAAASLAGVPPDEARALLSGLSRANLIIERTPGRYAFHDLLRAYASDLMETTDAADERHAAHQRLLDHYLHTAHAATLLVRPSRRPLRLDRPSPGTTVVTPADRPESLAWFAAEHAALLAVIERTADSGWEGYAWRLAWSMQDVLDWRGRWRDLATAQRNALAAAVRCGDRLGQAHAHNGLARAALRLGQIVEANKHIRAAGAHFGSVGDTHSQAVVARNLAVVLDGQGRTREALHQAILALESYPDLEPAERANALNAVGWIHAKLGNWHETVAYCEQALSLQRGVVDKTGEGYIWDSLGYAYHHLGDLDRAATCYQQAVRRYRDLANRHLEAKTLIRVGDVHQAAGDADAARRSWRAALDIVDELDHADADAVRAKLNLTH
jgi:DNA-binding SARP family transcriptional activator/tetratricopeptide (TPR) repeat protein